MVKISTTALANALCTTKRDSYQFVNKFHRSGSFSFLTVLGLWSRFFSVAHRALTSALQLILRASLFLLPAFLFLF